jgi:hypothetical protein
VGVYDPQFEERLPAAGAFVDSHGNQALIPTGIGR